MTNDLSKLEIPDCRCKHFRPCPHAEACDCPLHLAPACKHILASDHKLTLEQWRQLLEGHFGRLPHDHPDLHGEPPRPPRRLEVLSKEERLFLMAERNAQGFAIRHPRDLDPRDPRIGDRVAFEVEKTTNHVLKQGRAVYALVIDEESNDEPVELWEKLADHSARAASATR